MTVDAKPLSSLDRETFQRDYARASRPLLLLDAVSAADDTYALGAFVTALGDELPLAMRVYGEGHLRHPEQWAELGYARQQVSVCATQFQQYLTGGRAATGELYVVSDIARSIAGAALLVQFDALATQLGLELSHFGPTVTAWWGAPGHTEPLHVDIVDGTLWQLRGTKRVTLFPPGVWEDLYPFPFSGKMSWAFSEANWKEPDRVRFPRLERALRERVEVILGEREILYIPAGWAHEVTGLEGREHVLSVNRFWKTPMSKMTFLPENVIEGLVPSPLREELLRRKRS